MISNIFQEATFRVFERLLPLTHRITQCYKSIAEIKKLQKTEIIIMVGHNFSERGDMCLGSTR